MTETREAYVQYLKDLLNKQSEKITRLNAKIDALEVREYRRRMVGHNYPEVTRLPNGNMQTLKSEAM